MAVRRPTLKSSCRTSLRLKGKSTAVVTSWPKDSCYQDDWVELTFATETFQVYDSKRSTSVSCSACGGRRARDPSELALCVASKHKPRLPSSSMLSSRRGLIERFFPFRVRGALIGLLARGARSRRSVTAAQRVRILPCPTRIPAAAARPGPPGPGPPGQRALMARHHATGYDAGLGGRGSPPAPALLGLAGPAESDCPRARGPVRGTAPAAGRHPGRARRPGKRRGRRVFMIAARHRDAQPQAGPGLPELPARRAPEPARRRRPRGLQRPGGPWPEARPPSLRGPVLAPVRWRDTLPPPVTVPVLACGT
jgi:hypothetical protein